MIGIRRYFGRFLYLSVEKRISEETARSIAILQEPFEVNDVLNPEKRDTMKYWYC